MYACLAYNECSRKCYPKCRAIAPGFLDNDLFRLQTLQHVMRMSRTWDSTMSMIPKGGDIIWGGLDWSPEEGYVPSKKRQRNNVTQIAEQNETGSQVSQTKGGNYGRIISFGKDVAEADSSEIEMIDFRVRLLISSETNKSTEFIFGQYFSFLFSFSFIFLNFFILSDVRVAWGF